MINLITILCPFPVPIPQTRSGLPCFLPLLPQVSFPQRAGSWSLEVGVEVVVRVGVRVRVGGWDRWRWVRGGGGDINSEDSGSGSGGGGVGGGSSSSSSSSSRSSSNSHGSSVVCMVHPRNRFQVRYDLQELAQVHPPLMKYIKHSPLLAAVRGGEGQRVGQGQRQRIRSRHGDASSATNIPNLDIDATVDAAGGSYQDHHTIDFTDPSAVKQLNHALLRYYYDIVYWELPQTALCPPIPSRAEYIHYMADELALCIKEANKLARATANIKAMRKGKSKSKVKSNGNRNGTGMGIGDEHEHEHELDNELDHEHEDGGGHTHQGDRDRDGDRNREDTDAHINLLTGDKVRCLDIGTGASLCYPLIGNGEYGWSFVGTEANYDSYQNAYTIVQRNQKKTASVTPTAPAEAEGTCSPTSTITSITPSTPSTTTPMGNRLYTGINKLNIDVRRQWDRNAIFKGVLKPGEHFDLVLCNPPFFTTEQEYNAANHRKNKNLTINRQKRSSALQNMIHNEQKAVHFKSHTQPPRSDPPVDPDARRPDPSHLCRSRMPEDNASGNVSPNNRNFGGQHNELWYPGGEVSFITNMIRESARLPADTCLWFTSLVSQPKSLPKLQQMLRNTDRVQCHKIVEMAVGQKKSRVLMWTFLTASQRALWPAKRNWL